MSDTTQKVVVLTYINIDTTLPQLDSMQRLSRMVEDMPNIFKMTLKHEPKEEYIFHKSCIWNFWREMIGCT